MTGPFIPQGGPAPAAAPQPRPGGGYGYDPSQIPPVPQAQPQQQVPQPGQQQQQQVQQQNQPVPNLQLVPGGQQQQQAPQAPVATDLQQTLRGEHIPPQLQGRTVGEAIGYFNSMLNVIRTGVTPQQQQQQHTPQQQSMQAAPQPGSQQTAPSTEFFRDPKAMIRAEVTEALRSAIPEILGPVLGPVVQQANMTQAQGAQQTIVNEIGAQRFQQLYPVMVQYLSGMPAQSLASADTWRLAARVAAGEMALRPQPQQNPQQFQPQNQPQQYGTPASPFPVQVVGPNGQPIPGQQQFFTESPSGAQSGGRVQLTPLQEAARVAMGYDYDTYVSWLGGVQPVRR